MRFLREHGSCYRFSERQFKARYVPEFIDEIFYIFIASVLGQTNELVRLYTNYPGPGTI